MRDNTWRAFRNREIIFWTYYCSFDALSGRWFVLVV